MPEPLLRHWDMLRAIPRAPRTTTANELAERLRGLGYDIDLRSVQRDLQNLSRLFPLVADEGVKPYGWSWMEGSAVFDVPGMDRHAALAFRMASEHLQHLLPAPLKRTLEPWFRCARETLDDLHTGGLKSWPDKVHAVPPALPRLPPAVDAEVVDAVHDALFREKRLHLAYQRRGDVTVKQYDATPLALVTRDATIYLVATLRDYQDPMLLVLHRIQKAAVLDVPAVPPPGWDLQGFVRSGAFGFLKSETPVKLVVRVDPKAAVSPLEAPLGADQTAEVVEGGDVEVRVTLPDTTDLRTWLLGLGAFGEVLEPGWLRDEIAGQLARAAGRYSIPNRDS